MSMNNDNSQSEGEFDRMLDKLIAETEIRLRNSHVDFYQSIKDGQIEFFKRYRPLENLSIAYETLIYFMLHEEYDKCGVIQDAIEDFKETFVITKMANKFMGKY